MTVLATSDFPVWFVVLSWASIVLGLACAAWMVADVGRRPQHMAVMNVVWPVTALFGSVLWLAAYLRWGRAPRPHGEERSRPVSTFVGTTHCGAGCALGDLVAEWLVVLVPAVAVVGGYPWLFSDKMFAVWVLDFVAAFVLGIVFQYLAIVPMRGMSVRDGLRAALKADTLSITSWQAGMYGAMAVAQLWLLPLWFGGRAAVTTPVFWAAMQVAMLVGFVTSYPVNWYLVRSGVKEAM